MQSHDIMPSFESIYVWSREWQYLLAGLLTVLAACIFAVGSVMAAFIRAGESRAKISDADLRKIGGPANDDPHPAALRALASISSSPMPSASVSSAATFSARDMASNLDHLRWLIRTGLSPQLSNDVSQAGLINCCELIKQMQLENATLPNGAPETAQTLRTVLLKDANVLRERAETQAPSSEIISALIQLNTSARALALLLCGDAAGQPGAASLSR